VADSASKFQIAFCNLKTGGKVGDGQKALRTGLEDKDAAKRAAALETALKVLQTEAAGGQAQGSGAWYYWPAPTSRSRRGRADSAFTGRRPSPPTAKWTLPRTARTAGRPRHHGHRSQRAGQSDSAMYYFRGASTLYQELPHVYENMGVIFANADLNDSAAIYFGRAAEVAKKDTSLVDNRNSATLNLAMVLQRAGKSAEGDSGLRSTSPGSRATPTPASPWRTPSAGGMPTAPTPWRRPSSRNSAG